MLLQCALQLSSAAPVRLVRRVEGQVGNMGGIQACKALHLVRKAAVLVASLQQLSPDCMKPLMVLMQQLPMLLPYLQHSLNFVQREHTGQFTTWNAGAPLSQFGARTEKNMTRYNCSSWPKLLLSSS